MILNEEIETEILQTKEIASSISTAKAKITHCLTPTVSEVVATQHEDIFPATSLCESHDAIDSHIHSLASLRMTEDQDTR